MERISQIQLVALGSQRDQFLLERGFRNVLLVFVQYYEMLANTVKAISQSNANLLSNMPYIDCVVEKSQ